MDGGGDLLGHVLGPVTLKRDLLCEKNTWHLEAPLPMTSDLPLLPAAAQDQVAPGPAWSACGCQESWLGREGEGKSNLQKQT